MVMAMSWWVRARVLEANTSGSGQGNGNIVLGNSGTVIGDGGSNGQIYLKKRAIAFKA